jgi:hypothetical protein
MEKTGRTSYKEYKTYSPTVIKDRHKDRSAIDPVGKTCSKCKVYKPYAKFKKQSQVVDGHASACKDCSNKIDRSWYQNNKERAKKNSSLYYQKNKDKRRAKNKAKEEANPNFKLKRLLRHRLRQAIKKNRKVGSAVKDLGCTIEELKVYLESKFQDGMTWDNHGPDGWHIDHIEPLSRFDLTDYEQLKKACHYTNLQPLWAEDNIRKGNR